jgi:hypothetical protein
MRPPDLPEGIDARPAPISLRRRLLILAGVLVVIALILLATIPVTVVRPASVPFTATLTPDGSPADVATTFLNAPSTCGTITGNGTAQVFLTWSVESGHNVSYFDVESSAPPKVLYWPNDSSGGSFHFNSYCVPFIIGADAAQPQTVQVQGTWKYNYTVTGPIL